MHFHKIKVFAPAGLLAALCALPTPAQQTPPLQPDTAPVLRSSADRFASASEARIDPQARELLRQMAAAYRALTTYSGSVSFTGKGFPNPPGLRASVVMQKPDRIAIVAEDESGITHAVVDGARLSVASTRLPGYYLTMPAPPGVQSVQKALGYSGAAALSPTPLLFTGFDLSARLAPLLTSLAVGKATTLDGVAVETVIAKLAVKGGGRTLAFAIGKDDHLLRQVTLSLDINGKPALLTETHANIQTNLKLPSDALAFTPPPAAKEVVSAEAWATLGLQAAPAPEIADTGLVVLPQQTDTNALPVPRDVNVRQGRYEFGTISLLDKTRVEHTFTLLNQGTQTLNVARIQSSCGCTSALVQTQDQSGGKQPPAATHDTLAVLAPGQKAIVHVVVDLAELPPGPVHKSVSIYVQGSERPAALLKMGGTLRPAVTFAPALIDFGRVQVGEPRTLTLTADVDERLATRDGEWKLISTNPAIEVRPSASNEKTIISSESPPPTPASRLRTYTLTLASNAPIGTLSGVLLFAPTSSASSPSSAASATMTAMRGVSVTTIGQLTGSASAEPQMLALGVVRTGQVVTRRVSLRADTPSVLQGAKTACDSAWLSARVVGSDKGAPEGSGVLEVTLAKTMPVGALQTRVRITLANGQRLDVPVIGYVQKGKEK